MAKKTTKTSKKFEMKRSDISDKLGELIGLLEDLDVNSTSPNDMSDVLGELVGQLEELCDGVGQEAY